MERRAAITKEGEKEREGPKEREGETESERRGVKLAISFHVFPDDFLFTSDYLDIFHTRNFTLLSIGRSTYRERERERETCLLQK